MSDLLTTDKSELLNMLRDRLVAGQPTDYELVYETLGILLDILIHEEETKALALQEH